MTGQSMGKGIVVTGDSRTAIARVVLELREHGYEAGNTDQASSWRDNPGLVVNVFNYGNNEAEHSDIRHREQAGGPGIH